MLLCARSFTLSRVLRGKELRNVFRRSAVSSMVRDNFEVVESRTGAMALIKSFLRGFNRLIVTENLLFFSSSFCLRVPHNPSNGIPVIKLMLTITKDLSPLATYFAIDDACKPY